MFEHLGNCHGEWSFLLMLLTGLPFVGIWIRSKLSKKSSCPCEHDHGDGKIHP